MTDSENFEILQILANIDIVFSSSIKTLKDSYYFYWNHSLLHVMCYNH